MAVSLSAYLYPFLSLLSVSLAVFALQCMCIIVSLRPSRYLSPTPSVGLFLCLPFFLSLCGSLCFSVLLFACFLSFPSLLSPPWLCLSLCLFPIPSFFTFWLFLHVCLLSVSSHVCVPLSPSFSFCPLTSSPQLSLPVCLSRFCLCS